MPAAEGTAPLAVILDQAGLDGLLTAIRAKGWRTIGPRVADDAVIYDEIETVADLPMGVGDEQKGGYYRLKARGDQALFGYTSGAQGWKRVLYPPRQKLFSAKRTASGFTIDPMAQPDAPLALIGVRACEMAAINVQAKVFGDKDFADPGYQGRLKGALIVAVECTRAGDTCFCDSMGTGPEVGTGYDIKLVEMVGKAGVTYVATAATDKGAKLLKAAKGKPAAEADLAAAAKAVKAAAKQSRKMETATSAKLKDVPEHARWDQVAARCMTCGNCTMVCPTCFCTTVEDVTDLKGDHAERWRKWDSCFTVDFSYIHGGAIRTEVRSRYRQWITHKLSTWHDQFGQAGCVGCGRCITWCPVGIDITEEVAAIHDSTKGRK
ncbi:4Fe-4S dicluster domain-containing protein [Magnetospirillum moscoviense]|uniref:Sulfite reductase subunit A n=1 Tax=Magnetospirillum moscoviense TaxID=1437059 RepID=A0A178MT94_9PROT|nr:4Fe-4S dicluster domain-containing protein [Magnetospirillum moscoviense]OAN51484.1 sulfite reductase subunit A [Magnetospirillum moscoviense]